MRVRPLLATDLAEIVRIEQRSMTAPWSATQLDEEQRAANGMAWVAVRDAHIVGYAFFRTCPPECELVHLVVDRQSRRKGAGGILLDAALQTFAGSGYTSCLLEVRATNDAAMRLYAQKGFLVVGHRPGYYHHPEEDAILMGLTWPTMT
ncbi:MAG: ribosomal protein S18-alanine N-acetyltransferase [Desulfobulbus sp.]|jgi:ribosomal-protein-alanine N-acetyltransferase